jgi:hypothetical protein
MDYQFETDFMSRGAIVNKSGTASINLAIASKLKVPVESIRHETKAYWMDIDQMFQTCSGYGTYVEQFGHFIIYTKGIYQHFLQLEKLIKKKMQYMDYLQREGFPEKRMLIAADVAAVLTKVILLNYSVQLYKKEVLGAYPNKYKIGHPRSIIAVVARLEKLFNIPLAAFPITIHYPIQKVFVQKLRKEGILQNPVIDAMGKRAGHKSAKV